MRHSWPLASRCVFITLLSVSIVYATQNILIIRFTDTQASAQPLEQLTLQSSDVETPATPADSWLRQHGWQKVWPKAFLGTNIDLSFAGPPAQRYLRLSAEKAYAIWSRSLQVDPQQWPVLAITWAVERFPQGAALDLPDRNDRPIVVIVSFGPEIPSGGLRPDVPRGLAFFWGENATVGKTYTCIAPREGPAEERLQCTYPHIKYIALRSGRTGTVETDRVNLLETFRQQFPDYWQEHQHVPEIVGLSFEARSDRTDSHSIARLYAVALQRIHQ